MIKLPTLFLLLTFPAWGEDIVWQVPCEASPSGPAREKDFLAPEKLTYNIRWGMVTAGKGTISVEGLESVGGREAWHLSMLLETTGAVGSVHRYRDRMDTWLDRTDLRPLRHTAEKRQGKYALDETVIFDPSCGRFARTARRLDVDRTDTTQDRLPEGTREILGYIAHLRTQPLAEGQRYPLVLMSGRRLHPVTVAVRRREKLKVPAGAFDCFYLEPTFDKTEGTAKVRDVELWLSADERKLPVRIRMAIGIGHITANLVSVEP